jgi:hypothetical protein
MDINAMSPASGRILKEDNTVVNVANRLITAVIGTFSGSTTTTYTCSSECNGFGIINTGASDLTFTINDITITVSSGESFENVFESFSSVVVTATDTFKAIVKG